MDGSMFNGLDKLLYFLVIMGGIGVISAIVWAIMGIIWLCRHIHFS